jgi:hypothetical protein
MLKQATSGVLALLPCSRTESTLRASKELWPCWMTFLTILVAPNDAGNFLKHIPAILWELFSLPLLNKGHGECSYQVFSAKEVRGLPMSCERQSEKWIFDVTKCSG